MWLWHPKHSPTILAALSRLKLVVTGYEYRKIDYPSDHFGSFCRCLTTNICLPISLVGAAAGLARRPDRVIEIPPVAECPRELVSENALLPQDSIWLPLTLEKRRLALTLTPSWNKHNSPRKENSITMAEQKKERAPHLFLLNRGIVRISTRVLQM